MKRVLLVDDHAVVRKGLKQILEEAVSDIDIAEAADGSEAITIVKQGSWDALILDISLPGLSGLDVLKRIRAERKQLPILVLSMHPEEQYGIRVLRAGASGYLTKSCAPEKLVEALTHILQGGRYVSPTLAEKLVLELDDKVDDDPHQILTDREYQVMRMIASGKTVSAIAEELSLSAKTISTHRSRILAKMHMKNSAELTHYAVTKGLVD